MFDPLDYLNERRPVADRTSDLARGVSLFVAGDHVNARRLLERSLAANASCLDSLLALGSLHLELGDYGGAYFYFSRALRHDAGNAVLLVHLSECQRALGDDRGADESYERAMALWNTPIALPEAPLFDVEVAHCPYDGPEGFEDFLAGIELPPVALAAAPVPRDRGTQPLYLLPWQATGTLAG